MALDQSLWSATKDGFKSDELFDLACALSLSESEVPLEQTRAHDASTPSRRAGGLINFKKTWMYANSRLPPYMRPLSVYMPTWRLYCLAAQASLGVYNSPRGEERQHFIRADWHNSTKAMVIKSEPVDDQNVIVFAIRGSQMNFIDWSVNFRPTPTSPAGFLDDAGNACHAGFLAVAKAMVRPVAARLRQLLEQNPSRSSSSLLLTGHSAGGAVAALLYAHMLSTTIESELCHLTGCFKRMHCVTFGTPPITLLPLQLPRSLRGKKNIFTSFVNEGDPVARAERSYVLSLAKVLAAATPTPAKTPKSFLKRVPILKNSSSAGDLVAQYWSLPDATLCNAGSVVVIREKPGQATELDAVHITEEQLRPLLFGDPAMHGMTLYKQRIDRLAISAITGSATTTYGG